MILALTTNPAPALTDQPRQSAKVTVTATGYCLPGKMTCGTTTKAGQELARAQGCKGCIALSRGLARDLGLWNGKPYDYKFGTVIVIEGSNGYDGKYLFLDLMPARWRYYRVDIYFPKLRECRVFGVRRCQLLAMR
jgi:3D (Asp-Asp-Asp) domain-containing protein